jgi:hypothetical protein
MGLQYYGFGRYGQQGKVTHRVVHDKLIAVEKLPTMKPVVKEETANILENKKEDSSNYVKGDGDKVRVFMLRRSAAKEAHVKGGTVQLNTDKKQGGYIVKLNEEKNDARIYQEHIQEDFTSGNTNGEHSRGKITVGSIRSRTNRNSGLTAESKDYRTDEAGGYKDNQTPAAQTLQPNNRKTGFEELRSRQKEKAVKESIDKGIETGLSMAGAGESVGRDMGEKIRKKDRVVTPVAEMQGDETTASIGAQKEDELKKIGINLSTFKSKNVL